MIVTMWGGVVLAETVVELAAKDEAGQRAAARIHYLIDLFVEIPLLAGVLITGGWLMSQAPVLTNIHMIKITAGLLAIGVNLYCAVLVILRQRHASDPVLLARYHKKVFNAWMGVPFGLLALVLGLRYFAG